MPKRSTDFQKLVLYLHKHFHPDAVITESKELIDKNSGQKREVDVYIEVPFRNHVIKISIECIEHGRKADVNWIGSMRTKHEHLDTDCLMLISKKGFTKGAKLSAEHYKFKTFSYNELKEKPKENLFQTLYIKQFDILSIERVIFEILNINGRIEELESTPELGIFDKNGKEVSSVNDFANWVVQQKTAIDDFALNGLEEHTFFTLIWEPTLLEIFLHNHEENRFYKIWKAKVVGKVKFQINALNAKWGKIDNMQFAWGKTELNNNPMLFVGVENEKCFKITFTPSPNKGN